MIAAQVVARPIFQLPSPPQGKAIGTQARNFKLQVSKRRAPFTILPRKVASFYVRPPNLWRTLWRTYFVFELSTGRSGRI
jgi:hypothetical protein